MKRKPWTLWYKRKGVWRALFKLQPLSSDCPSAQTLVLDAIRTAWWSWPNLTRANFSEDWVVLPEGRKPKGAK